MKKSLIILPVIALFLTRCKPADYKIESLSSAAVTNASPSNATPLLEMDVMIDGLISNPNKLSFPVTTISKTGVTVPYLPIGTGERLIQLSKDSGKTSFVNTKLSFDHAKAYSIFVYDTLTTASGQLPFVRLTDDLTLPTGENTHIRFLHLAPRGAAYDITFVRGTLYDSITGTSTQTRMFIPQDSVTLSNKAYVGANPDANALSAFTPVKGSNAGAIARVAGLASVPTANKNNRYEVVIKAAGTQNVIFRTGSTGYTNLTTGKIYTLFAQGTAQGKALGISIVTNY